MYMEQEITKKETMEDALTGLLGKYGIPAPWPFHLSPGGMAGGHRLLPGNQLMESRLESDDIPLLSWRVKRPFEELRKIVKETVVEQVCLLRFSCLAAPEYGPLAALIYREADLCEYIGGGKTESVFAVWDDQRSVNLVIRLDTGILCSIELSLQLPRGSSLKDRHEIIGRRGTASDRVVDTQVPQHSIYHYTETGDQCYTDTDMELFGFDDGEIEHVRSAFEACKSPQLRSEWASQHQHLIKVVQAAIISGEKREKVMIS